MQQIVWRCHRPYEFGISKALWIKFVWINAMCYVQLPLKMTWKLELTQNITARVHFGAQSSWANYMVFFTSAALVTYGFLDTDWTADVLTAWHQVALRESWTKERPQVTCGPKEHFCVFPSILPPPQIILTFEDMILPCFERPVLRPTPGPFQYLNVWELGNWSLECVGNVSQF